MTVQEMSALIAERVRISEAAAIAVERLRITAAVAKLLSDALDVWPKSDVVALAMLGERILGAIEGPRTQEGKPST
ncbi:MAG TPA: hypothetical protein VFI42_15955 [Thermomicrobiaceae bacterium]|nr:hypothetical protein [Thermomicrobiaceae bacterium]